MIWATLDGRAPEVIAHRGASGLLPEHSLAGYALGLAQGADLIEPDLVPSADGVLFCRHEPALARSTDVASQPALRARRRVDGDWYSQDFAADELDRLHARQAFAGRSTAADGLHALPRFAAMIDWAARAADIRGQPVVLYPEIKHPTALAAAGCDPVPMFIAAVRGLPPGVQIRVQCFEAGPLRRVVDATGLPATLLVETELACAEAIDRHADWLATLGADKQLLWRAGGDSGLLAAAHAAGLRIDAWTYRDDQPAAGMTIEQELEQAMRLGVDGLFCDFPATAVMVRAKLGG
jgi:glycerophosphoryl diester phosphodiesterase